MFTDGLAPLWCQDICNHHNDFDQSAHIRHHLAYMALGHQDDQRMFLKLQTFCTDTNTLALWHSHLTWNIILLRFSDHVIATIFCTHGTALR